MNVTFDSAGSSLHGDRLGHDGVRKSFVVVWGPDGSGGGAGRGIGSPVLTTDGHRHVKYFRRYDRRRS